MSSVFDSCLFSSITLMVLGLGGGLINLLHKNEMVFSKIKHFTDLTGPTLCIFLPTCGDLLNGPYFMV